MSDEPCYYDRETDAYLLKNSQGNTLKRIAEIGIVYQGSGAESGLLKHGSAESAQAWYDHKVAKLRDQGLDDLADNIRILRSTQLPCEEINRCLTTSGYVGRMVERLSQAEPLAELDGPTP